MGTWSLFSDGSTLHRPDTAKGKFFYNEPGAGKNARRKDAQPRRRTEFPNVLDYNIDFDYT